MKASSKKLCVALKRALRILTPPPTLTLTEWSERNVRIPNTESKPGPYRSSSHAYQREIADALSDPSIERVVVQAASQVGKTQIELNSIGYFAATKPGVILCVVPNEKEVKKFSKRRVTPMIEASPELRRVFAKSKARSSSSTIAEKEFIGGGYLDIVSANIPADLASVAARVLLIDEIDRFEASAGSEGDPVDLAIARTTTFFDRKILMISTPTIEGVSRIQKAYLEGDQRRFYVRCPKCEFEQLLVFDQIKWAKDAEGNHLPETAHYECARPHDSETGEVFCGEKWTDVDRHYAVRHGRWIAQEPLKRIASFHLSQLYSPAVSFADIATKFLSAKRNGSTSLMVFMNTVLGETWREKGERPDWERVYDRRDPTHVSGQVPRWVGVLTAGVDVQRDRLEASVWGWGRDFRSVLVEHRVLDGAPTDPATWAKLDELLNHTYPGVGERRYSIAGAAVDTGGQGWQTHVYDYARRHPGRVFCVRGSNNNHKPIMVTGPTWVDGRKGRNAVRLFEVTTALVKAETYAFLQLPTPLGEETPRGWITLPIDISDEFIKQLVSEEYRATTTKRGTTYSWEPIRERNEALDCRVYARALAWLKGLDQTTEERWNQIAPLTDDKPVAPKAEAQKPLIQTSGNWMNRLR